MSVCRRHQISAPPPKLKKRQEEARCGKGDREAEHDLDQPAKAARRVAEGEAEAGDDDDDDRHDLGDRPLDALEDRLQRRFPRHRRARRMGRRGDGKGNEAAEHGGGQACTGASKCLDHEITPLVWGVMGRIR
jgi:hypothetical protein